MITLWAGNCRPYQMVMKSNIWRGQLPTIRRRKYVARLHWCFYISILPVDLFWHPNTEQKAVKQKCVGFDDFKHYNQTKQNKKILACVLRYFSLIACCFVPKEEFDLYEPSYLTFGFDTFLFYSICSSISTSWRLLWLLFSFIIFI